MQKSNSGRRTVLWLTILLLLFIGISYFLTPDKPDEYAHYVTESPAPSGVKAIYTYLHQHGTAERSLRAPEQLPKQDANQLLIMVEPFFTPDQGQMNDYLAFMESGNTILLLKTNPEAMFDLTTTVNPIDPGTDNTVNGHSGATYRADIYSPFRMEAVDTDDVLLSDNAGTIALKREYGSGALIAATTPALVTNEQILKKDHLPLVLGLLQEESEQWNTIYFDEYIHGGQNAAKLTTLYPSWMLISGFQVILFTLLLLWYQGKRFGTVIVPREETVRFSDERIQALAAWYMRGKRYHDSFTIQADYVKMLLQERWGIPYRTKWMDITEQLEKRRQSKSSKEIQAFLDEITAALRKNQMSKQEYVLLSKKLDRLQKEVEER